MRTSINIAIVTLVALSWTPAATSQIAAIPANHVETIVGIRHGEQPADGLGQLDCRGFNRALALPKVLVAKYGRPDFIFAPNPAIKGRSHHSYVRALTTIEPTAIALKMPVNAQLGKDDIQLLQQVLTGPAYEDSLVFVAWEHGYLDRFAKNIVKAFGGDASAVPDWPSTDYDSIFVIRLTRHGCRTYISFKHDHEDLNNRLSDSCPKL